ncbi:lipoyl(octanoyl) transferase LipB [Candidatus Albibeggiatoa sp. nov. NOAA]|uniref:lipoyl(octanoyl) transferase LipB n=1 Tax=Candidatus Albibeggiatoa sp. nov. NOAA TaxID=3162724 RepID=UPI0032F4E4F1|nr:lipoyl(octanoyl) transferase LipB [Thiotrichaceae bacterium]
MLEQVVIKQLGLVPYITTYDAMRDFTLQRDEQATDELWMLQHPSVYTMGLAAKPEHLLNTGQIPVEYIDRGGQVTYHGTGQLVVYVLMNVKRRHWGVRHLVQQLEQAVIDYLASENIEAQRKDNAPGVYVGQKKIASLGLRIKRGCSYHGLSLNVDMDLEPFQGINPCGYEGLEVTQLKDLGVNKNIQQVGADFLTYLLSSLDYTQVQ